MPAFSFLEKVGEIMADGRIIIDTEIDTSNAEKGIKNLNNLASTGLKGAAIAMTGFSVALTGAFVSMAKDSMEFEAQMSRVAAISGATGKDLDSLRQAALEFSSTHVQSAKEVAQGMENLSSAGFDTKQVLQALPGVLNLATAASIDLAQATDIVSGTLRGFGLNTDQTTHLTDVFAKAAADTNAELSDMGYAMKYVAPVAHQLNQPLELVTAAIGELANQSIKGTSAGEALRTGLDRLVAPAKAGQKAMDSLGFSASDASGNTKPLNQIIGELNQKMAGLTQEQKQQAVSAIFGKESMAAWLILINDGQKPLEDLTTSLKNSDGAGQDMANTISNNLPGALKILRNNVQNLGKSIMTELNPTLIEMTQTITKYVQQLNKLNPEQQQLLLTAAGIAASIGPGILAFIGLTQAVGGVSEAIGAGATAIQTFGGNFGKNILDKVGNAGSAFLNLGGVAKSALSGLGGTVAETGLTVASGLGPLPGVVGTAFGGIQAQASTFMSGFGGQLVGIGGMVLGQCQGLLSMALSVIGPAAIVGLLIAGLGLAQQSFGSTIDPLIQTIITKGPTMIQNFTQGILSQIPNLMNAGTSLMMMLLQALIANLPQIISSGAQILSALINGVASNLPRLIPMVISLISVIASSIVANLPQIIQAGLNMLVALANGFSNNSAQMTTKIVQLITQIAIVIIQNMPALINAGIQILVALIRGVAQMIPTLIQMFPGMISAIWNAFKGVDWLGLGANIVRGIISGIGAAAGGLFNSLKELAGGALNAAKSALGIHSPSRLFADIIGTNMVKGIGVGVENEMPNLNSDIDANMNDLTAKLKTTVDYETAKTTAGVVAQNNYSVINNSNYSSYGSGLDTVADIVKNLSKRPIQTKIDIDGKTAAEATNEYHDEINSSKTDLTGRGVLV